MGNQDRKLSALKQDDPRTYVLVHGAWHGGWCWKRVRHILEAAGHRVYTPTQTGLGERSHLLGPGITLDTFVQDICNVLVWEDLREVILVGHSFGGIAITGAADRERDRIAHLVYLDALVLQNGHSPFSVVGEEIAATRREQAVKASGGTWMPVPDPSAFGVVDPQDAAWLRARCTPHPILTYEDRLVLEGPVGAGLPVTYIAVTPPYQPGQASRAFARAQPDWIYLEIEAGHDAMVTSPGPLAEALRQIGGRA